MTKRFAKRRWRRPERMLLEHAPVMRRKDLGVSEPLPVESELGRKTSRRQIQTMLAIFLGAAVVQGALIGFVLDVPLVGAGVAFAYAVVYFFVAREFGDAWIVRALQAEPATAPRVARLAAAEAKTASIPTPRVLVAPGELPNAAAFALRRRWLVATQGAEQLDELALEGLIAHEIVHLRDGDASVASLFVVLAGGPDLLFRGGGFLAILSLPLLPVAFLLRGFSGVAAQADREHRADIAAAMLTRYPPGVGEALRTCGGPTGGLRLFDRFWFVARGADGSDAERRADLVSEM